MKTIADYAQSLIDKEAEWINHLYSAPAKTLEEYNKRLGVITGLKLAREVLDEMMNTNKEIEFDPREY